MLFTFLLQTVVYRLKTSVKRRLVDVVCEVLGDQTPAFSPAAPVYELLWRKLRNVQLFSVLSVEVRWRSCVNAALKEASWLFFEKFSLFICKRDFTGKGFESINKL